MREVIYGIGHIPRKENNIPDILSRSTPDEEKLSTVAFGISSTEIESDPTVLHKAQCEDPNINEVIEEILADQTPQKKSFYSEFSAFVSRWRYLHVNGIGVLLKRADGERLIPMVQECLGKDIMGYNNLM